MHIGGRHGLQMRLRMRASGKKPQRLVLPTSQARDHVCAQEIVKFTVNTRDLVHPCAGVRGGSPLKGAPLSQLSTIRRSTAANPPKTAPRHCAPSADTPDGSGGRSHTGEDKLPGSIRARCLAGAAEVIVTLPALWSAVWLPVAQRCGAVVVGEEEWRRCCAARGAATFPEDYPESLAYRCESPPARCACKGTCFIGFMAALKRY